MAAASLASARPAPERIPVMGSALSIVGLVPAAWTVLFGALVLRATLRLGHLPWPMHTDFAVDPLFGVVHSPLDPVRAFPLHHALVAILGPFALMLGVIYPLAWLVVVLGERGVTRRWTWPVLALAIWAPIQMMLDPGGLFLWTLD